MSGSPQLTATGQPFDQRHANVLLAIFAGMALMVTYVETMVLPAFKQFYTFFGLSSTSSYGTVAWILSAYLLVGTVVVPIFGKLGDLYGKKRMLVIAMGIYAVAVTVAGFTPNIGDALGVTRANQIYLLIAVRAVQGIGMGMFPLAFAMIPEAFPAAAVGRAQGVVSAMFAGGAALGLAGGGWIAQTYGWQDTYHTVIPAAILLVILAIVLMKESPTQAVTKLDLPGIVSLGGGLAWLLLGITEGPDWGWTKFDAVHWGALPWGAPEFFALAIVFLAFFIAWEPRVKFPVIRFESLKPRNIWVSNVNAVLVGALMFFSFTSVVILSELPSFLGGLGVSEFTFGLLALPSAIMMLIGGGLIGAATSRLGPKPVSLFGYGLAVIGSLGLTFFHSAPWEVSVMMIPLLVGNVALLIAMSNMIVLSVDRRELGVQTGMNQTFRNVGSAIAPVVTTSVLASFTAIYLVTVSTRGGPIQVPVSSYAIEGFQILFAIMAVLAVFGLLLSMGLKNYRFLADGTQTGGPKGSPSASPSPPTTPTPTPVAVPEMRSN